MKHKTIEEITTLVMECRTSGLTDHQWCKATYAWIVAAYDDSENVEKIEDPWKSIITKRKYYHDVRVRGDKKSINMTEVYQNVADKTDRTFSRHHNTGRF